MNIRSVGERVMVIAPWNTFFRQRGRVTQVTPYVMVLLDDERLPMRFDAGTLVAEQSERHVGGAE